MKNKIGVVGSRGFNNYPLLVETLSKYNNKHLVSGGAKGADALAQKYAKDHGIPITIYYPGWDKYGKGAGFIRNEKIVKASDKIVAFWDSKSKGTKNTIDTAKKYNVDIEVIKYGNT